MPLTHKKVFPKVVNKIKTIHPISIIMPINRTVRLHKRIYSACLQEILPCSLLFLHKTSQEKTGSQHPYPVRFKQSQLASNKVITTSLCKESHLLMLICQTKDKLIKIIRLNLAKQVANVIMKNHGNNLKKRKRKLLPF